MKHISTTHVLCVLFGFAIAAGAAFSATSLLYISGTLVSGHCLQATSDGFGAADSGAACASPLAGNNVWTGTQVVTPTSIGSAGNIDLSGTGGLCGRPLQYTGATAGTLTVLATAVAGCSVPVYPTAAGLATIAAAGSGTIVGNTACTANPRTLGTHSVIWVTIQSNAGSAPVINVSGDCG